MFTRARTTALFMLILSEPAPMGAFAAAQGRSAEQLYNEANGAYDRGDVSRAISLYERVVKLQPDFVPARTNLAVALAHDGRYQEAVVQYLEALKRDPKNSTVRLNLALAWRLGSNTINEVSAGAVHAGINQFLDRYGDAVHAALDKKLVNLAEIDENLRGRSRHDSAGTA